jgi:lipopolysaccharide export system protein LptA
MINLHEAVYALNSNIAVIRGDIAYDADEQEVAYDMVQAEAKLAEMQAEEIAKQEAQASAKQSAMAKLAKLGLTEDEIKAMLG